MLSYGYIIAISALLYALKSALDASKEREKHMKMLCVGKKKYCCGYTVSNVDNSLVTVSVKGVRNQQHLEEFNEGEQI